MKKLIPFFIIVGIIVIFFRQFFLQNLLPIPSDTIVGLYHPFRDLYAKNYPHGIPFKNFLITDPVRQEYPWRYESILQEKLLQLPLWNPYNFAGTPLLANGQSAAFNVFNVFLFFLPFPISWSLLILFQPILAGIFMFLYLKNLKLHTIASMLGSVAFIFSGFFVAWLQWGTVDMSALWLPLVFLSIDKALATERKGIWWGIYFLSLLLSFFAGHLQTFFYILLIAHGYFFLQWLKSKKKLIHLYWGLFLGTCTLIIASVQLIPLFQFILHSGRNTDLVMTDGWFVPYQHLITFFVPDFFGNPTTLNYWGSWNYAELAGYIGIPALLFAFFSLFRKSLRTYFFVFLVIISLLFALPTLLAFLPFTLHIPFISTAQPTRLLFLIDFSLCVLAAMGMNLFIKNGNRIWIPMVIVACIFSGFWIFIFLHAKLAPSILIDNILTTKRNLLFPTSIFTVTAGLIAIGNFFRRKTSVFLFFTVVLFFLSAFDSLRFADKFTPFTKARYLFPNTKTTQFLQKNVGNFRIIATDSQILPPNFSLMYQIESVDGYDPLYIQWYGAFIASMERNAPDIHTPFGFNRIITPQNYESRFIDLLGVKYVLSLRDLRSSKLKKVFSEGQTQVYENLQVLPRAFFVKNIVGEIANQKIINDMFNLSNQLSSTAIVFGKVDRTDFTTQGSIVSIHTYSANVIDIQTNNPANGFLVLTDVFYPSWHAFIDGKETKIYPTDYAFRGVIVPAGKHTIEFKDQLF